MFIPLLKAKNLGYKENPMARSRKFFRVLGAVITVLLMALVIALFAGVFSKKMPPGKVRLEKEKAGKRPVITVKEKEVEVYETAVGSIRALHETTVSARVLAKIVKAHVRAGMPVKKGQLLFELDDKDFKARVAQAKQAIEAAKANAAQAKLEMERAKKLFEKKMIPKNQWDRTRNAWKAAQAELERAKEALKEAETMLSFTKIKSPLDGVIVDKLADQGDMAAPGKPLVKLYDPKRMQLWAMVRESLAINLTPGMRVGVELPVLDRLCFGRVDEVVPATDVASRTFLVKVSGPCPPGLFKGMYGKLRLPVGKIKEIRIPLSAVGTVGQLTLVKVVNKKNEITRRFVRLGKKHRNGTVTVLSGLEPGERILRYFGPEKS